MATRIKRTASDLYERDFYVWSQDQARLLRERHYDRLDLANLIEEVEDLGGSLRRAVRSRATTIMLHLLKLEHSPADPPRSGWRDTVRGQRTRLLDELTPTLRQMLEGDLSDLYARARHDAAGSLRDHGEAAAAEALPDDCPYTVEQVIGDWLP